MKRGRPKRRFLDVVKEDMGKLVQRRQTLKTGWFGLWLPLIEGKGRKKEIVLNDTIVCNKTTKTKIIKIF